MKTLSNLEIIHLPAAANILGEKFLLGVKNYVKDNKMAKVRFIIQGHKDKDIDFVVHIMPTVQHRSMRVIILFTANECFPVLSNNINQVYLQNDTLLQRDVNLQPK